MKLQDIVLVSSLLSLAACNDVANNGRRAPTDPDDPTPPSASLVLPSGMIRTLGTAPITYAQENADSTRTNTNLRSVPEMQRDDEGTHNKTARFKDKMGRPVEECGLAAKQNVNARVADCRKKNGVKAVWDGAANGSSTENLWELVALKKTGSNTKEIWVDRKTGMVWSDIYGPTNWCEASGNDQSAVPDFIKIDCNELLKDAVCYNRSLLDISEFTWRLPTRNDYLQADLDGLRFVMKKGDGGGFWTATMSAAAPLHDQAWTYNSDFSGLLETQVLTTKRQVRCIGVSTL